MLTVLRIKNLALVADLTLELQPGFSAVTGETGAGKSIIIGALNLVVGERAERSLIRSGSENCSVEAVFDIRALRTPVSRFLDVNGLEPCEDNQLVLKRTLATNGTNRQFVNGSPSTLNVLAALGEWLVDIHGPHDHQSLLHPSKQLAILDAFGSMGKLRDIFAGLLRNRAALEQEKMALIADEKGYAQKLDLLRFQVHEIAAAKLRVDEEAQLDQDYYRASNTAKLIELGQSALAILSENENSLLTQAGAVGRIAQDLQRIDPDAGSLLAVHGEAVSLLQDLQNALSRYLDRIDLDPARLQEIEERLNLMQSLKRKYGATVGEVIAFQEEAARRLQALEQRDSELSRIQTEIDKLNAELWRLGRDISMQRRKIIPKLKKAAMNQLADLGLPQSNFDIALQTLTQEQFAALNAPSPGSGLDAIEFQFSPNVGEPARPLRAIASSGEMSRVMLALKTVLAVEDEIPLLIFDEVDANIGGETAHAVGEKMRQIGQQRQVLCITHLAPVAAGAANHFIVTKQVKAGRTISEIHLLDLMGRVEELARMLGGQGDAARKHAEALLGIAS